MWIKKSNLTSQVMSRPDLVTPIFCVRPRATCSTSVLSMGRRRGAEMPLPHVYTDDRGKECNFPVPIRPSSTGQNIIPKVLIITELVQSWMWVECHWPLKDLVPVIRPPCLPWPPDCTVDSGFSILDQKSKCLWILYTYTSINGNVYIRQIVVFLRWVWWLEARGFGCVQNGILFPI